MVNWLFNSIVVVKYVAANSVRVCVCVWWCTSMVLPLWVISFPAGGDLIQLPNHSSTYFSINVTGTYPMLPSSSFCLKGAI